jgi:2'-hydroxyisoflavone reductase
LIDIRDLAEWSVRMIERRATGIYNVVGPQAHTDLGQVLSAARDLTSASPEVTWAPSAWLVAQKYRETWGNLLFWSAESEGWGSTMRMGNERALANGLTMRPLSVTLADAFEWYKQQSEERQARLLRSWKKKPDGVGVDAVSVPWPTYLEREKEILSAWHAQHRKK